MQDYANMLYALWLHNYRYCLQMILHTITPFHQHSSSRHEDVFYMATDCFEDFVSVLGGVDALVLAEVYAAGEPPIVAADGRALARALRVTGKIEPVFVENIVDMPQAILSIVRDGDVVITMGAGSIGTVPGKLVDL